VVNKSLGGIAVLLLNGAMFLGPIGLVQSMDGLRFAFVFILTQVLAQVYPELAEKPLSWREWLQKIFALILFAVGIWFATQIIVSTLPALA
jgi:uncharacterized membrane-anchored protein